MLYRKVRMHKQVSKEEFSGKEKCYFYLILSLCYLTILPPLKYLFCLHSGQSHICAHMHRETRTLTHTQVQRACLAVKFYRWPEW